MGVNPNSPSNHSSVAPNALGNIQRPGEYLRQIRINQQRWRKTLAVEFSYSIEGHDIHFDLMLLFTEDSVPLLTKKLAYLIG